MSQVAPVHAAALEAGRPGRSLLEWTLRLWVVMAVFACLLAVAVWAVSHRIGRYDSRELWWWGRKAVGNEYRDNTIGLRRDTFSYASGLVRALGPAR